jgi:hypothetical protein
LDAISLFSWNYNDTLDRTVEIKYFSRCFGNHGI